MRAARLVCALVACAVAASLAGCSQVAALAPVGGNGLAEVRFGAIDVLQQKGIDLLEAPVCATVGAGPAVTCTGRTLDGHDVSVASSVSSDARLDVLVGGQTLFSGLLSDVLDAAARG
ncbi:hypothetical protein IC744_03880 [Microbacterium hominis]|uniref:hypothetical protein n=1 Tax=Microbacterium TaxID=33882 RepID=UPI00168BC982|nr:MULTISPECIES: hypothetical protein [Microbacterium]QOC25522.1 hypothetical protein IC745_14535 [Microbacterium hominis]QOC29526.1 hypothetical protein IC744_03880 [Microbacterium hominis]QYF98127.1 hypothetical protein KY498_02400 [Microbacterium sp. PAMC21962]